MDPAAAVQALLAAMRADPRPWGTTATAEFPLLQSVVDAAAILFEAEAASIALYERDPERLAFRVASGQHGAGVVGRSVLPSQGVVGYVFSTGQAIALSDVSSDPRFDRDTAERTGYVPRSIAAVPLIDGAGSVGVLQVLDKQGSGTFSLQDMSMLGAFARQASVAFRASRVARDAAYLLRSVLAAQAAGMPPGDDIEARFARATADLDDEDAPPFWRLVDRLAALADRPDRELSLVADLLAVVMPRGTPQVVYRRRGR